MARSVRSRSIYECVARNIEQTDVGICKTTAEMLLYCANANIGHRFDSSRPGCPVRNPRRDLWPQANHAHEYDWNRSRGAYRRFDL